MRGYINKKIIRKVMSKMHAEKIELIRVDFKWRDELRLK